MEKMMITQDEYGCVLNSEETYISLANSLLSLGRVVFAWTDEDGTQLDILLAYFPLQHGTLQRGMNYMTDLFVAVSSFGMFGFELNGMEKYPNYVAEKLGLAKPGPEQSSSSTDVKLAELINGICRELEAKR